jgi:hypothetical protein
MSDNRVLRRIFPSNRDDVTGGGRKLHDEEVHNLYSSTNTIRVIKSRRMIWAGHVPRMGEIGNLKGRHHLGDLDMDRSIILKWS